MTTPPRSGPPPGTPPGSARTVEVAAGGGVAVVTHLLGGHGPPVVFAHAAGMHGRVWEPVAQHLAGRFRCVAPDLRGHGDSLVPDGWDFGWEGFAADLRAAVDGLGLDRPFGVGHSSGATALLLAEQATPGMFAALYCYEPVVVPADPPRDPTNWLAERTRRRRTDFASRDEALRRYAGRPPLEGLDPAALRAYVEHGTHDLDGGGVRLKCRPDLEALVYEMATAHDCFVHLGRVCCRVTVAVGGRSEAVTARHVDEVTARLPDASVVRHPELAHLGPLEDPAEIARSIRRAFAHARSP